VLDRSDARLLERAVVVAVALGALLAPLNSTMIAVALPQIVDDFDTTLGTAGWLVTTYLLALAVVQPIAGKLGDRHGRRPFVVGGLAVFGVASLGAALAPSLLVLSAFRVTQAISGAVVFPNGSGLIRELVPSLRRGRALGIVGGSIAFAAGIGPLLGGILVTVGGWRAIFLVNVPVVAAALATAAWAVPRRRPEAPQTAFDWLGAVLLATILVGTALLVIESGDPWVLAAGTAALAVVAAVFVRRELRHPDPLLQPRFFRIRCFAAANAGIASSNFAFYTVLLAVPVLLTRHLEWSTLEVGFAVALLSAPMVVCAPLGGRLADNLGRRSPSVAGCVLLTAGIVPLALSPDITPALLIGCLAVVGAGVGLSNAGLQAAALEALEPSQAGIAAGVFSTSRYVGSFAGSIALARLLDGGHGLDGFRTVFVMTFVAAVVSVVATTALPKPRSRAAPARVAAASRPSE
jgi:EmrB/QacA subfamily drug resistance transporter